MASLFSLIVCINACIILVFMAVMAVVIRRMVTGCSRDICSPSWGGNWLIYASKSTGQGCTLNSLINVLAQIIVLAGKKAPKNKHTVSNKRTGWQVLKYIIVNS